MTIERETTGPVVADISNEIVKLVREHFGKGPTQAKTIWHDDVVVAVLRGGYTQAERTLIGNGKGELVEGPAGDAGRPRARDARGRGTAHRSAGGGQPNDPDASVEIFLLAPEPNLEGEG